MTDLPRPATVFMFLRWQPSDELRSMQDARRALWALKPADVDSEQWVTDTPEGKHYAAIEAAEDKRIEQERQTAWNAASEQEKTEAIHRAREWEDTRRRRQQRIYMPGRVHVPGRMVSPAVVADTITLK